ncbi:MAG: amidase, partial [Chloroflexi bacterium]|nr:amidase [Chloroflexota bacterium]
AIVLGALAGHDAGDPQSSRRAAADYLAACAGDLHGLRVGVLEGPFFESPLDPQVASAVAAATQVLGGLGAALRPARLRYAQAAASAALIVTMGEASSSQDENLRSHPEGFGDDMRVAYEAGEFIAARQYLRALRTRPVVQRELGEALRDVDVLVCPTTPVLPWRIDASTVQIGGHELDMASGLLRLASLSRVFSFAGVPALSVPCGFSVEGLPIGMQIVGRPWDEATILRVGHAYEQATAWHQRRPSTAHL